MKYHKSLPPQRNKLLVQIHRHCITLDVQLSLLVKILYQCTSSTFKLTLHLPLLQDVFYNVAKSRL